LTGLAESILILKKIQNDVVLVKKKVNGLQLGFAGLTCQVGWVTPGHDFSYFFFNPARFHITLGPK
jgi:hypothetical protein